MTRAFSNTPLPLPGAFMARTIWILCPMTTVHVLSHPTSHISRSIGIKIRIVGAGSSTMFSELVRNTLGWCYTWELMLQKGRQGDTLGRHVEWWSRYLIPWITCYLCCLKKKTSCLKRIRSINFPWEHVKLNSNKNILLYLISKWCLTWFHKFCFILLTKNTCNRKF